MDARRPARAIINWGPHYVGHIDGGPGAEPLGGRHLRAILAGDLAHPLTSVLATVAASGSPVLRQADVPAVSVVIPAYNAASNVGRRTGLADPTNKPALGSHRRRRRLD